MINLGNWEDEWKWEWWKSWRSMSRYLCCFILWLKKLRSKSWKIIWDWFFLWMMNINNRAIVRIDKIELSLTILIVLWAVWPFEGSSHSSSSEVFSVRDDGNEVGRGWNIISSRLSEYLERIDHAQRQLVYKKSKDRREEYLSQFVIAQSSIPYSLALNQSLAGATPKGGLGRAAVRTLLEHVSIQRLQQLVLQKRLKIQLQIYQKSQMRWSRWGIRWA